MNTNKSQATRNSHSTKRNKFSFSTSFEYDSWGRSSRMLCKCEVKGESEKSLKYENAICGDMQKDQQPLNTRISEDISKSFAYLHFCFFTCLEFWLSLGDKVFASILLYAPAMKGILSSPRV